MKSHCEVIICGDGLFATLCSVELQKQGVKTLRLCSAESFFASSRKDLGVFWSSLPDPPTRAEVAHGHELAVYLNEFLVKGMQLAQERFLGLGLGGGRIFERARTFRLALQEHEVKELKTAQQHFSNLQQVSGADRVWFEPDSLLVHDFSAFADALLREEAPRSRLCARAVEINETGTHVAVLTADGQEFQSEILILGVGADSGKLLPRFESVVVPMNDVTTRIELQLDSAQFEKVPFGAACFRAASGHVSGVMRMGSGGRLALGLTGPRYALPLAGVGALQEAALPKIRGLVWEQLQKVCPAMLEAVLGAMASQQLSTAGEGVAKGFQSAVLREQEVKTDCLPCDELPLLGEWGSKGRVLGNAGWLGCGYSAAFEAARIVCELVLHGRSADLHPLLSPKRLQSLCD